MAKKVKKTAKATSKVVKTGPNSASEVLHELEESVGAQAVFENIPANVGIRAGCTIPTGDYASARVEVSLHVPCRPDEIDDVFEFITGWVDGKMETLIKDIVEQ